MLSITITFQPDSSAHQYRVQTLHAFGIDQSVPQLNGIQSAVPTVVSGNTADSFLRIPAHYRRSHGVETGSQRLSLRRLSRVSQRDPDDELPEPRFRQGNSVDGRGKAGMFGALNVVDVGRKWSLWQIPSPYGVNRPDCDGQGILHLQRDSEFQGLPARCQFYDG